MLVRILSPITACSYSPLNVIYVADTKNVGPTQKYFADNGGDLSVCRRRLSATSDRFVGRRSSTSAKKIRAPND